MNVGQLRKAIADLPADAPVLTSSSDHSYRHLDICAVTARYEPPCHENGRRSYYCEDHGDDAHRPEEKKIMAAVLN